MKKNFMITLLAIIFSVPYAFGQNTSSYFNTKGIITLDSYSKASALPVTDSLGAFAFVGHDDRGNAPRTLWEYSTANQKWIKSDIKAKFPAIIYGRTDLTAVQEHSLIKELFWKDDNGTFWCLSAISNQPSSMSTLLPFWQSRKQVIEGADNHGNKIWQTKIEISIEYNELKIQKLEKYSK